MTRSAQRQIVWVSTQVDPAMYDDRSKAGPNGRGRHQRGEPTA